MKSNSIDWSEDLPVDPEEEYQTFVRSLKRTASFRLLFVRCTPAKGKELIERVKQDLPQRQIEVLSLDKEIDNLYKIVEKLAKQKQIDILFIQGLEYSFYQYENIKFSDSNKRYFYGWQGVPKILNHLNQQREQFRDTFDICFVFLLRTFSLKYFIHRAPDFFDWRSGEFEFSPDPETVEQESFSILREGDYQKYVILTPEERKRKIIEIQALLDEDCQTANCRAKLLLKLGNLLNVAEEYEEALASYDQALEIKPDEYETWFNRANVLSNLGRYEEALSNYNQALEIKPDEYEVWLNRANALDELGRYREADQSYSQASKINLNQHETRNNEYRKANQFKAPFYTVESPEYEVVTTQEDCYDQLIEEEQKQKIQQIKAILLEALAEVEPQLQSILQMSYGQGLTIRQISQKLNINQSTVARSLRRTEEKLLLRLVHWISTRLYIAITSDVLNSLNSVLKEWLQDYYFSKEKR